MGLPCLPSKAVNRKDHVYSKKGSFIRIRQWGKIETGTNEKDLKICNESIAHTLDLLVCEKRFELGGFAYQNLKVERIRDFCRTDLLYSLHTLIPAENLKEETHTVMVKYPATWWQAFKEQYFPTWLKNRCPIRSKTKSETVTFIAYNLYPKFPNIMPERCMDAVQTISKVVDYGVEE